MAGDLEGVEAFLAALRSRQERVDQATRGALERGALIAEGKIKRRLTTSSHRAGTPTPSAPGEPPSLVTGTLRRSIRTGRVSGPAGRRTIDVYPTIVYGRIHELGGTAGRGAQLPPRPYVWPGLLDAKPQIRDVFTRAWRDAIT